jgi:molybdopterin-binding protein
LRDRVRVTVDAGIRITAEITRLSAEITRLSAEITRLSLESLHLKKRGDICAGFKAMAVRVFI